MFRKSMKPSHPIGQVEKKSAIDGQIFIRSLQVRYKLTIPYVYNHKNESFGIFMIYYLWYHKLHEHSVRTEKKLLMNLIAIWTKKTMVNLIERYLLKTAAKWNTEFVLSSYLELIAFQHVNNYWSITSKHLWELKE